MDWFAKPAQAPLTADEAVRLREMLGRLVTGDGAGQTAALASQPQAAAALRLLQTLLIDAEPRAVERPHGRIGLCIVAVDGLGMVRQLDERHAQSAICRLDARITQTVPGARLRRTGRSTLEFAFPFQDPAATRELMAKLQDVLEARLLIDGQAFDFPITLGYALGEVGAQVDARLIEAAEHALARAQAQQRKVGVFDEAARAEASDRLALMRDLRRALDTDDVYLVYQPKAEARSGRLMAAEALIRWRHPERGLVPPDAFIGLAEQTGEIRGLTERVVRRAIADQARLHDQGFDLAMFVNVSGALVADERFTAWLLERAGHAVGVFGLEVTETAMMGDAERALAHMRALADAGLQLSIDDYGTGQCSLSYLKTLPAHELKIDKSFIMGLTQSHRDPLIVRSTIDLAHALGMKVTAEGVDSPTSRALLTVMGCDYVQGFEVCRPLRLGELADRLREASSEAPGAEAPPSEAVVRRLRGGSTVA